MHCASCLDKECERAEIMRLKQCRFGVPYLRRSKEDVERLEEPTPLRSLADNLRHELHQFLQVIVNNACEIDESVTVSELDPNSPASRIVAATVLINNFVEIIAGVNNFDPPKNAFKGASREPLRAYFSRAIDSYGLLESAHRCSKLIFINNLASDICVAAAPKAFEYIACILIDNCYKYSQDGTYVSIDGVHREDGKVSVRVMNYSDFALDTTRAFERGYKNNARSSGYGYGLFWTRRLIAYMNEQLHSDININVSQQPGGDVAQFRYCFELTGVPCG